ncbi:nucleotide-binding protein [bacterium]|nr:nucleotide-binding protein [bacterium]BFD68036.1 nucleotide-binding protein [Bdellovibrio sp. HAGR004]
MIERFQGDSGLRLMQEALLGQFIVNNDGDIANDLSSVVELREYKPGDVLIKEGASDNDIYLIFSGLVGVRIKDREIARRTAGQHIGEMALIDLAAKRSATVSALDETVVAVVTESDFSELATKHPVLWRRLALTLGQRLRERSNFVRQKNETPRIFIGSSVEGLDVARAIQTGLAHDPLLTQVWTDDVFKASKTSIENLVVTAESSDFGILVLGSDDKIQSRDEVFDGPRDNVIFELGLLIGAIGRDRVFIVKEQKSKIKIPTDLLGTTPLQYQPGKPEDLQVRVAAVCSDIRRTANEFGAR